MKFLKKYFERIDLAIRELEVNRELVIEAKKNIKLKKTLEEKVIKLNKEKISSIELIDQALEEIKILRNNVIKENKSDV